MIITADVGNTTTKIGIFNDEKIITTFKYITNVPRTSDELGVLLHSFLQFRNLTIADITGVIISSVVPDTNFTLVQTFIKYFNIQPIIVGPGIKTGIKILTENPKEVGSDRICDVVAAYELYKGPVIVLNFGTATRYDHINEFGEFNGAITSPGIKITADALWKNAAKLPQIEIKKPASIMATNTITSMQAGLVYGQIGQVEYIIKHIKQETGRENIKTVACGGYANIIMPHTDVIDVYDPLLTLKGLKILYDKNK